MNKIILEILRSIARLSEERMTLVIVVSILSLTVIYALWTLQKMIITLAK